MNDSRAINSKATFYILGTTPLAIGGFPSVFGPEMDQRLEEANQAWTRWTIEQYEPWRLTDDNNEHNNNVQHNVGAQTMKPAAKDTGDVLDIIKVSRGVISFNVLGQTPLVCNRMSQKALHELILPRGRKTATERMLTLKHNPIEEYRSSPYILGDNSAPTAIAIMATAFKGAMKTAALDLPGAKKAQVGRLVYVEGEMIPIYGVPQIYTAVVRSADMNRTPDVRTRAILPRWAAKITVVYTEPLMRYQAVANLLGAAGFTAGVGDGRPEKGSLNFGQFQIVEPDNAEFLEIVSTGGRAAQQAALAAPAAYDDETRELLEWFDVELKRRQVQGVIDAPTPASRRKSAASVASKPNGDAGEPIPVE